MSTQFHSQTTSFLSAQFHGQTSIFYDANFSGHTTSFMGAEFHGQTSFQRAQFYGETTEFSFAKFHGQQTDFFQPKFQGQSTDFQFAEFLGQMTDFRFAEFLGRTTDFSTARFRGKMSFTRSVITGDLSFRETRVAEDAELSFDSVDLSRTLFLEADLRRMTFLDVRWDRSTRWREGKWRWRLHDEALWRRERSENPSGADKQYLDQLARLYRALKGYYRQTGEYQLVGHFHYGLLEVQLYERGAESYPGAGASRRERIGLWFSRWRKRLLSWDVLYRLSSGYGEDYAWAALVAGMLLIGFALLYWCVGVPALRDIEWTVYTATGPLPVREPVPWSRHALAALLYSVQTGSLGRVHYFTDPRSGRYWARSRTR
jgi:uncharacterized protein YjbI with pentapeptide repeats